MNQDKNIALELMWEGVECFYFAYANGWTYTRNLDGWHPDTEKTVLLDFRQRSVRCYYDRNEMQKVGEAALPDFLDQAWVERFIAHSHELLKASESFIEETHLKSSGIDQAQLTDRIRRGTKLLYDTLLTFLVTQPQYSAGIEPYLFSILPNVSREDKQHIIATLAQSSEPSLITEEEDAWNAFVARIKQPGSSLPVVSDPTVRSELERHALRYGLVYAADGNPAADVSTLYMRLMEAWEHGAPAKDRTAERTKIEKDKQSVIAEFGVSEDVARICDSLARLSHIRLETRLRGWMPLEHIVANELIPELTRFLPYTAEQLESCRPDELEALIRGETRPTSEELDERRKRVVVGVCKGQEVLWVGSEAEEKLTPLLPTIDYGAKEIKGQIAMKGKATGPCHIISWELDTSTDQIHDMPPGAILVAGQTRPQLMEVIKKASAIVTDEGGLLSHAAIVSRELRIPCVIGTKYATKILKQGEMVEVDADAGIIRRLTK